MPRPSSTIIVGAGVVGLCTAYYLAKRGHKVTIVDRGSPELAASKGNAGIIALGHPPLPRPGLVWKTIKWMLNRGSPLYVPPRIDFGLFAWMWNFHRACTPEHFRKCMQILAAWGWATGKCWDQIVDDEKIECEYRRTGWLDVFRTEDGMKHGRLEANLSREFGFSVEMMSGDELRRSQPAFRKEIVGAAHYTDSRSCSPIKFITQLTQRVRDLGVEIHTQTEVGEFTHRNGASPGLRAQNGRQFEADSLVLAAGVWTMDLARKLGVKVPMQAGKGYHVNITPPTICPTVSCVLNETYVAVTPMDDGLRLAGTVELSGTNLRLLQRRVDMLSEGARNYIEGIDKTTITSSWCGLRPCTADGLPVIGWAPRCPNVFIATGHAKYGLAYGPITGKVASECILGDAPSLDITPMRVDRF